MPHSVENLLMVQCMCTKFGVSNPKNIKACACVIVIIVIETPGFAWRKPKTARPRYSKKLQLKTTTYDVSDYAYRTAAETDASLSDS